MIVLTSAGKRPSLCLRMEELEDPTPRAPAEPDHVELHADSLQHNLDRSRECNEPSLGSVTVISTHVPSSPTSLDEDELIDFWLSPVLQSAMIESPKEQEIIDWNCRTKPSSSYDVTPGSQHANCAGTSRVSAFWNHSNMPGSYLLRPVRSDDDQTCDLHSGTKKSVTFGPASFCSVPDTSSDYFSMSNCKLINQIPSLDLTNHSVCWPNLLAKSGSTIVILR